MKKDEDLSDVAYGILQGDDDDFEDEAESPASKSLDTVKKDTTKRVTGKDGLPKTDDDYYDLSKDWDVSNMSSRQQAKLDVAKYKTDNVKNSSDVKRVDVPFDVLGKIMLKNYDWAKTPAKKGQRQQLMMYVDNKRSDDYGIYTLDDQSLNNELSLVYAKYDPRYYKAITNYITARTTRIAGNEDVNLVAVHNGYFNVKTKKLKPFTPKHVFNAKLRTDYPTKKPSEPKIKLNTGEVWSFTKFLKTAVSKDQITTVRQVLLDCFDANVTHNRMVLLKGSVHGGNGKSFLMGLIQGVVGDGNYCPTKITDFDGQFGLSEIPNTVCALGDDISSKDYLSGRALEQIRTLTTGHAVEINTKSKPQYSYVYKGLIMTASNGYFKCADLSGMKRRMVVIPMVHQFNNSSDLDKKVNADAHNNKRIREYILWWALNQPMFSDYGVTKTGQRALNEFEKESNHILEFAQEAFLPEKPEVFPIMTAYHFYQRWARDNNFSTSLSTKEFSRRMLTAIESHYTKKRRKVTGDVEDAVTDFSDDNDIHISNYQIPSRDSKKNCFVLSDDYNAKDVAESENGTDDARDKKIKALEDEVEMFAKVNKKQRTELKQYQSQDRTNAEKIDDKLPKDLPF